MAVAVATARPTACCRVSGVKRANSALRVFGSFSFLFFCRPGARTPRVSGGALRASAAEIVHTYMHMIKAAAAAILWRNVTSSTSEPKGCHGGEGSRADFTVALDVA